MPRGGARPGAGRPKGSKSKRSRAIAILVRSSELEGLTPLEVMLRAMRAHAEAGHLDEAAAIAKDAAPYLHPRLTAVEHSGGMKLEHQAVDAPPKETREEWLARRNGELQGGVGGPAGPASGRPDGDLVH